MTDKPFELSPWPKITADLGAEIDKLRAEIEQLRAKIEWLQQSNSHLYAALHEFRSLVKEGGVPRYTITPGAALNSVIEETIDPVLRQIGEDE